MRIVSLVFPRAPGGSAGRLTGDRPQRGSAGTETGSFEYHSPVPAEPRRGVLDMKLTTTARGIAVFVLLSGLTLAGCAPEPEIPYPAGTNILLTIGQQWLIHRQIKIDEPAAA